MSTAQFVHVKGHRMELLDIKQSYLASELYTHREKIALRYCDAIINDPTDADEAMWKELHAEFSEPELVEMGHYVGFMSGGQRWLLTLHTTHGELDEFMAKRNAAKKKAAAGRETSQTESALAQ